VGAERGGDDLAGDVVEPAAHLPPAGGGGEGELLLAVGLAPRAVRTLRVGRDRPGLDERGERPGVHLLRLLDEEPLPDLRIGQLGPEQSGAGGLPDEDGGVLGAQTPRGQGFARHREVVAQRPRLADLARGRRSRRPRARAEPAGERPRAVQGPQPVRLRRGEDRGAGRLEAPRGLLEEVERVVDGLAGQPVPVGLREGGQLGRHVGECRERVAGR